MDVRLVVCAFGRHLVASDMATGRRVWVHEEERAGAVVRIAIAGRRVFLLASDLRCLDYETGRELWRATISTALSHGNLLVVGDAVVLGDGGEIACHDAATGAPRWSDAFTGMGVGAVALAVPDHAAQIDRS